MAAIYAAHQIMLVESAEDFTHVSKTSTADIHISDSIARRIFTVRGAKVINYWVCLLEL
jgi:hypothetical protein